MYLPRLTAKPSTVAAPTASGPIEPGLSTGEQMAWLCFIVLHAPLGLWMHAQSLLVFGQATLVFGAGMWWAITGRAERVAYAAAYIVGSEVLWRMTTDALWWESGKYSLVVLFSASLLNRDGIKSLIVPGLCFLLLVPSMFLTVQEVDASVLRGVLSFNMSGPLALVVCCGFFSKLALTPARTLRMFLTLLGPIVAIGAIVVLNIASAEKIHFTFESNFATSGNFGPNQVSLILGLGALASLWCVLENGAAWPVRLLLFGAMLWFAGQSALTFSRGGPLGFFVAGGVALFFLLGNAEARKRLVIVVPLVAVIGIYGIWPALVNFTGGALSTRYHETGLTHRDELGNADLELWAKNPVLGIGPGLSPRYHTKEVIAHTEFTRVLAEHGMFGAIAIGLLLCAGVRNVFYAASARERGLVASALVWSVLFMLNAAMRTVSPSFMCGLSFCTFIPAARVAAAALPAPATVVAGTRRRLAGRAPSAA